MLGLFTDFGASDVYVGQLHTRAAALAPSVRLFDISHELTPFNVAAAAHLLQAMVAKLPELTGWLAVVDPGVGTERGVVAAHIDGRWLVGPDNGMLSVVAARADSVQLYRSDWQPDDCSMSFHGRDIFLPLLLELLQGRGHGKLAPLARLSQDYGPEDLPQVIYVDHYGNLFTGIRACNMHGADVLRIKQATVVHAETFERVPAGTLFWYENSAGLVEIAANQASAASILAVSVGEPVSPGQSTRA